MHAHHLNPPDPLLRIATNRLGALAAASGPVFRYLVLSILAVFFFTAPIAFREVFHVHHRSASRT